ncbi:MAG: glycosyltransferase family 4 protein, partial [Spirulina sp. SIO3F2]|nr:glycosyltransferase family 4 protein [Spirulina sp. SIO3F2]
ISTRIGGLTDIIIDQFNGLLISPTKEALLEALIRLIEDEELREKLGENAIQVSQAFSKKYWKEQWKKVIVDMLNEQPLQIEDKLEKHPTRKRSIELRVQNRAQANEHAPLIHRYLMEGYDVFIRSEEEIEQTNSFSRLQFINQETDLAFNPDEVMNLKEEIVTVNG